ncbi:MAG: AAA family ATPase, partial [Mycobacterium sp.]
AEDRADALLATGRAAEIIGELEAAVAEAPLRERRWGQLMLALYRAGRQSEALGAYQRARSLLVDELGIDPGPELRRLEAAIVSQDSSLDTPVAQHLPSVMRAVTFLLTDIEGSTAAWEEDADAMAVALARHDELIEQVVTSRGGRLIKTRGEGDATFSVFERPSAGAAAALELQDAISQEPWALREPVRIRVALHTGEVELRDGDYFGRAVNRAARLRSLAGGGQILCSGAVAELVIDSLPDDVVLADLGMRQLRNLPRPEHVFELRFEAAEDDPQPQTSDIPMERPGLPAVLLGPGPFVGRGHELDRLLSAWQTALAGGVHAVLIAGEPGVGKTRLAGEWSLRAYEQGAAVLYGRCDEDLGAPYQPFAEALRSLIPCVGASRLRGLRGVEALLPLVPGLADLLPDLASPARADPDTERYALFDAVVAVFEIASASAPVVLILDDLHWAAKPTLLLLRHLLRFCDHARVQIVGTYRSTDLDRSHPLAAMLADLHRDGTANRLSLSGLDEDDVTAYVAEAGYDDEDLAHALASVTGGNPFFLIEALRHVDESGGVWDQSTLPQGVREAVSRRLSRLPAETNKALAAAAVVGSRFALEMVELVIEQDLVDAFDEASKAGIVIEEPGGYYRFNHAIVRQSLLAELASVRRMRIHQRIATTLESQPGADDELLAELAHHYFECAWAGNAAKAVFYCRRAADQAMARLAYEGAADLYDHALHALEEIDEELPDRDEQAAELLVARCEALLAAGDVASASGAVSQLQATTVHSARLAAWATCFDGQLSMLVHSERLGDVEAALGAAAEKLARLEDAAGEAKAHTVRAASLARLGRIGDCEVALDDALTAARRAREHRRVNAVLAGAPLAALWGPNPVARAGGRCLDVVRLLRITTESPAVEATSTRCQAVLEAFRGRAAPARRMIDSARRTVTELGLRHALLEVEQFAGIVELVGDDPEAAEPHLRKAYNGFRRMGLDADTAETAALLGRACLALDRDGDADELCMESENLAGHALKPSIAWRTLRAQLLARRSDHREARRIAEAAVALAERTDLLVDHGDACLALATVLDAAGNAAGARAAAEQAAALYERKGAAALVEKARRILDTAHLRQPPQPEGAPAELTNACVQAGSRLIDAVNREAWDDVTELLAPYVSVESRRNIVGFTRIDIPSSQWPHDMRHFLETGMVRYRHAAVAVRGERFALTRLLVGTADLTSGAPQDEFLHVAGLDEDGRIALQVWFDLEDIEAAIAELDAAHARFEDTGPRARRLENAASQVNERLLACFSAREWEAFADILAQDVTTEDRRRVVNAGVRQDRDAEIKDFRLSADLGVTHATSNTIATRGDRLALTRSRYSHSDGDLEAFSAELLGIVKINADDRIEAWVTFDLDDFDAAIAELDARYIAGAAAAHARTWSAITGTYASLSRGELPAMTPDCVTIDHRRVAAFAPGELPAYISAGWDIDQTLHTYVEVVHKLNDLGAVCTYAAHGVSREDFRGEWREVAVATVDGDMVNRCELFDEAELKAAIAIFEQLNRPARRLENAASQIAERLQVHFAARDWSAMAEALAADISMDDRRRVVGEGSRQGRDAVIAEISALAEIGVRSMTPDVIAIRGGCLVLSRVRSSGRDPRPDAFRTDVLDVLEIDADGQVARRVVFDIDDFEGAVAELDARYLAGEAAAHARTWSVITGGHAALNRHELPPTTPDCVSIDHRQGTAFAPGELIAYFRAGWDVGQEIRTYVEVVHRLSDLGAVCTHVAHGVSHEGFDAEWRGVDLLTVEGDLVDRCEAFDEADLDAAIATFEQLSRRAPRLENAASHVYERFQACFAARDWATLADITADDCYSNDRRRVVNGGIIGRGAVIESFRSGADLGLTHATSDTIAIRGGRLVLTRDRYWRSEENPESSALDLLQIVEIDTEERIAAFVTLDPNDFDGALGELESRYLAGEAAAHARSWSVVAGGYASMSRGELPAMTPDCVTIDHRKVTAFAPGELHAYISAGWDVDQSIRTYVEVVHRLNSLGAVVTHAAHGIAREGFEAEWREVCISMSEGDLINRCELFEEADLDAAIAKFEELTPQVRRLENAASWIARRSQEHFTARNWDAMTAMLADDFFSDDRRRVVNAGIRRGRDAGMQDAHGNADVGAKSIASTVIATRGQHLVLLRARYSSSAQRPEAFHVDVVNIYEIDDDERISSVITFDPDDFDAAIVELDARYRAGEAGAHAPTWSAVSGAFAAINRHELPERTPDWVNIDHRRGAAFATGEMTAYLHELFADTPNINVYIEVVHRLSNLGAVVTQAAHGTSQQGFQAEWRETGIFMFDGDLLNHYELFDDGDLDTAIARFEELHAHTRRLENTASQVAERFVSHYAAADWDAMSEILANDFSSDDRREVIGAGIRHGRDAQIADMRAIHDLGITNFASTVIAIRGERLALVQARMSFGGEGREAFLTEVLGLVEIAIDERMVTLVSFDLGDFDAAIAELDAGYLAGEAAAHSHAWSAISQGYAVLNRGEIPTTTTDMAEIDHRPLGAIGPGDLKAYLRVTFEDSAQNRLYIETVHRLTNLGAVVTNVAKGTSQAGFDAEWRMVLLMTADGGLVDRGEIFEETDLDAALARFEELHRSTPQLANAATRVYEQLMAYYSARDWTSITEMLSDKLFSHDRRAVVGAGIRHGQDALVEDLRAVADVEVKNATAAAIATRGGCLALARARYSRSHEGPDAFHVDFLQLVEIDANERITALVAFDPDDIDAAFEELDARYLAGEGAAHSHTWSVIARLYAGFNRQELPATTAGFSYLDHRSVITIEASDLPAFILAGSELTPYLRIYMEAVHRLTDLGAVVTHTARGVSHEDFDAEWRMIDLFTADGNLISRCEMFDEADLNAALARFDELGPE